MAEGVTTIPSRDVADDLFGEIQELRSRYYSEVFEGYPDYFVPQFVGKTTLTNWRNPNKAVGSDLTRAGQRFARPMTGLLYDRESFDLAGVSLSADNASSAWPGPAGVAERTAKLYMPIERFRSHRYRVIRELAAFTDQQAGLLIGAVLEDSEDQPKAVYPLSVESRLISVLRDADFKPNEEFNAEYSAKPVFVPPTKDMPPIYLQRFDLPATTV